MTRCGRLDGGVAWGRSLGRSGSAILRGFALSAVLASSPGSVAAQEGLPSGQALVLWEVLWEPVEGADKPQAVLRFIAPGIAQEGGQIDAEAAQADLLWLCTTHGLPLADLTYAPTGSIVVNLMDRPVPRGKTDPESTQYFGLYQLRDGRCEEEAF